MFQSVGKGFATRPVENIYVTIFGNKVAISGHLMTDWVFSNANRKWNATWHEGAQIEAGVVATIRVFREEYIVCLCNQRGRKLLDVISKEIATVGERWNFKNIKGELAIKRITKSVAPPTAQKECSRGCSSGNSSHVFFNLVCGVWI